MNIPRDDRLRPGEGDVAREPYGARSIRPVKQVEGAGTVGHAGQHMGGDDPINPGGIGAAGLGHGHATTLDILLSPTIDVHNAPIGNWPVTLTGSTDTVYFVWRVPTEWTGFNSIGVVMIPDTEEQIQMDIDVSVSAEGEQYDADERQSLNETKAIAAGDVDDLIEWDILDIGPLFADIAVGDFVTVKLTSDIDGLIVVGLHINYDAGGWSGGGGDGGASHDAVTIGADAAHSLAAQVLSAVLAANGQTGHMSSAMFNKLAGIAAGADVTGANPPQAHGKSKHTAHANWKLLYTDGSGDEQELALPADGSKLVGFGTAAAPQFEIDYVMINYVIDGGGSDITTGVKGYVRIPAKMVVVGWGLGGDNAANEIVIDVWLDSHANYPPTVADTMVGGGNTKPILDGAIINEDDPVDWDTTALTAGYWLGFNVDSVGGTKPQRVTLGLKCKRLLDT